LKVAGVALTGLPFPVPGVTTLSTQFQYFEDMISSVVTEESLQSLQGQLKDMETWFSHIVENGDSMMEGSRLANIKRLVGDSYTMLSEKALKEENVSKWSNSMEARMVFDNNGKKCKIKWVKV